MTESPSKYKSWGPEDIENLLSNFLINSWSYSKVTTFARNQKHFEMSYIYMERSKMSPSTIAGQAYHVALQNYFVSKKEGEILELPLLEAFAFDYIEEVHPASWKLQKTTPSVEECRKKAFDVVTKLLRNFYSEKALYEDEIKEVLDVEIFCNEFLVINGVEIPMPCHMKIDLVIQTHEDKIAIIDHKSKAVFSSEEEMKLGIGVQAITYVKGYEASQGLQVDQIWFVENKYAQNKDGSPQLSRFMLDLDDDSRRMYEILLYEPLKAMIEAVNNPDHTYIINPSDNFVDMAEMHNFCLKTMIAEVSDFDIPENKQDIIARRLRKTRDASLASVNPNVIKNFRQNAASFIQYDLSNTNMTQQEKIEHVLRTFGVIVRVAEKFEGYSSNTFLLEMSAGTKVTSVQTHRLDIANMLDVSNVRVAKELTVYNEKSYLAVDFSKKREKSLVFNEKALVNQKIPLGKDNFDNIIVWDLDNQSTPHALVCGQTGSGKSVLIKSTVAYAKLAKVTDIIIFDPKYEFRDLREKNIRVFNDIDDIEMEMAILVEQMNDLVKFGGQRKTLIVFDEFADAVAQARRGKELGSDKSLEQNLKILLQKSRSVGFRVLAATQRASVKVITGDAKANFPVVVCFRLPKVTDSMVVLDEAGAESLSGGGDGLIKSPQYNGVIRFQGYFKQ